MSKFDMGALCLTGLLATLPATSPASQGPNASETVTPGGAPAAAADFIADDDGGVVQIVPIGSTGAGVRKVNAAPLMKSIRQVSLFLGGGWAQHSLQSRADSLSDLAADRHVAALPAQNVDVLPAAPSVRNSCDFAGPVNDLTIQHKLVELLDHNVLPVPDASTVYVLFLAPGVQLTVGNHTAGVHFAAYHNLIHVAAGELRYVVVPFDANASQHATAASLAIVDTVFNPQSY